MIQFKEESKEKLSLPRDTLYSRTPVSAWTLMSVNLLPGIILRFYPVCYHTDFHLPKPSCVAGVPRGKQIWVFRAPSKTFWCSVSINISKDCRLKFKGFKYLLLCRNLEKKFVSVREGVKKKTFFFGTLSQTSDPTHPPRTFGTPLSEK